MTQTPPETGGAMAGRIIGGLLLFIVFGVVALACAVLYFAGWFIPPLQDWAELIGDGALFVGAIALGISITGFELMRRGRRKRGEAMTAGIEGVATFFGEGDSTPTVIGGADDYNPNRIPPKSGQSTPPPPTTPTVV